MLRQWSKKVRRIAARVDTKSRGGDQFEQQQAADENTDAKLNEQLKTSRTVAGTDARATNTPSWQIRKPSPLVIFSLPSALSTPPARRAIVCPTIGKKSDGERLGSGRSKGLAPTGSAMVEKKQKVTGRTPSQHPRTRSATVPSAVIGTVFNMVATLMTFRSVLLCLIVAKHFT
jgi:hypothetical protein